MRDEVDWITDALSSKNIAREMTHYRIQNNEIRATDGRLTAGHPFPHDGDAFLVPGSEFEKLVRKLPGTPSLRVTEHNVILTSGTSRGMIKTLPIEQWEYPGVDDDGWEDAPAGLIDALRDLRPFVSDNATQAWALGVCLYHGYAYATNNIALAGVRCDELGDINAILPVWAVDFLVDREEGLVEWAWTDHYVAFRWDNGAWMRAQLIDAVFPEQAINMILQAQQAEVREPITAAFREVFKRAVELCDGAVHISNDSIGGSFGEATFKDEAALTTLEGETIWSTRHLAPVIAVAGAWEPSLWPRPAVFKGDRLFGYVLGRRQ